MSPIGGALQSLLIVKKQRRLITYTIILLIVVLGTLALDRLLPVLGYAPLLSLPDPAQNFVTVFLGIFIEAAPFLLMGSVASGLIAVFVTADDIARAMPRSPLAAALVGSLLGLAFPVCECGVVPVVRRLHQKGLPISAGVSFLLAAPVINPVVIAATYAAFGTGPIFWARIIGTFIVAFVIGAIFSAQPQFLRVLRPRSLGAVMGGDEAQNSWNVERGAWSEENGSLHAPRSTPPEPNPSQKLQAAFGVAADDFFDMGRYLVVGTLIATTLQIFVPQQFMVNIGHSSLSSVIALQVLAFVLSVCSTVDAFLALSFVNTFSTGAIIAFLIFGPMVDMKSTLMFAGLYRPRVVAYLIALPFMLSLLIGLFVNLNLNW